MAKPIILFHDISKGEAVEREMTDEEYNRFIEDEKLLKAEHEKEQAKEITKNNALSKLIDLGLTEEEVEAFLG